MLRVMESTAIFSSVIFLFLVFRLPCKCGSQDSPAEYKICPPFRCGNLNARFPFYSSNPRCGRPGFELSCNPSTEKFTVTLHGKLYQVVELFISTVERLITIYDSDLVRDLEYGNCDDVESFNAPLPHGLRTVGSSTLILLRCNRGVKLIRAFNYTGCSRGNSSLFVYFDRYNITGCSDIKGSAPCDCFYVPVVAGNLSNAPSKDLDLLGVLSRGFPLEWDEDEICTDCEAAGEGCGYDAIKNKTVCLPSFEQNKKKSKERWKVILGATTAAVLLIALGALFVFKFRTKASYIFKKDHFKSKRSRDDDRNVQLFIKSYQSTLVSRFSYYEIQKMTNNLKDKIGEGGYGTVFKGKLADGRFIAAKVLDKSRNSGQDFINEVATIGRIHHVNVIRLLGFCFDGSKRVLIYEFMQNGSLGRLISKESTGLHLGWPKLLEIAIGVAHGIEYLHQGCETRILHLDIKPQNVLLDHNYNPKISDFGLAKSYSRKQSAVPLTDARGTIGYIAPEVFFRTLGGVSHKSDVYSYGMLLLEMVGGRKNAEWESENSSKQYFPNWIYDQVIIEGRMDIVDSIVEEDMIVVRKMVMVGLWCIQMNPADRPSMSGVLEMLTGNLGTIDVPPKPFLFSPPRPMSQNDLFDPSNEQELPFFSPRSSFVTQPNSTRHSLL